MTPETVELFVVVTRVVGYTKACARHSDSAAFSMLSNYYATIAEIVQPSGGCVIKVMGDAVLIIFPIESKMELLEILKRLQSEGSSLWKQFDETCQVQVKADVGTVASGLLGVPGSERYDIVGDVLNRLFKAPWGDLELSPEVQEKVV